MLVYFILILLIFLKLLRLVYYDETDSTTTQNLEEVNQVVLGSIVTTHKSIFRGSTTSTTPTNTSII